MEKQQSASIELIEHYYQINRYDQVVKFIKNVMDEQIENARLWYMLGYSNYQLNCYEEAEEQLIESMRLGAAREHALFILGHLYMETEQYKKSEEAFLEALRIDPNDAQTHASYALLMKKLGHREKAKMLIGKALELEPGNPHVLRYYFRLEGLTSEKAKRLQALEHYMNSGDSELSKLVQLGMHASLQNNTGEALEYFRQAFLLKPEDQQLLTILEEMTIQNHPLLMPLRLVERIGGPAVIWGIGIGMYFLLHLLGLNDLGTLWVFIYLLFVIYSWIAQPLVRTIRKKK